MTTLTRLLILVGLAGWPCSAWAQEELTVTKIYSPAATDLTLAPASDVVLTPTGKDVLPGLGYDINLGQLTKKYLTLHAAELWVETLVAQNTVATIGGRVLVGPTNILSTDLASGATTITVKYNNLANGDRVYLEANAQVEFMAITSGAGGGAGAYTYAVTRNLDGSGANDWTAGDAVFDTGQTGNGWIDLYSVRGMKAGTEIGPTIVGNVRNSSTYNDWSPRWAIGNLDGLYGYTGSTYGSAFGVPGGARVTVDATNGIRMYGGDNDAKVTIDTSGNATFDGAVTIGTGRNMIRNSECKVSTDDWSVLTSHGLTTTFSTSLPSWILGSGAGTCYVRVNDATPGSGQTTDIHGLYYPAAPGQRYEASAYLGTHRSLNSQVLIAYYNNSLGLISATNGSTCPTDTLPGGSLLTLFCRSVAIGTAPAGTAFVKLVARLTHSVSGNDPYLFLVRAYLGEASTAQEDPTEWGPGGITSINNGLIETDAINARTIAADSITTSKLAADSVTSAKIVAGTIVASDIATGTITATQIAASTITGSNIAGTTITGDNIAGSTITASKLSVSTLSAISADLGTITAGSITGGTIDGATIRAGSGDEVTLDSSGISLQAGTGANNKIKWSDGVTVSAPNSGSALYVNGALTVERTVNVTGTGAGANAITVSGGYGIAADTLNATGMGSSTGTAVIWETACACLKKDSSSLRYKVNVQPWRPTQAQRLLETTPIRFDYRPDRFGNTERHVVGLSAEEIYRIAPEAVNLDANGNPDSIRQGALNVYLIQILKELRAEIDALKKAQGRRWDR